MPDRTAVISVRRRIRGTLCRLPACRRQNPDGNGPAHLSLASRPAVGLPHFPPGKSASALPVSRPARRPHAFRTAQSLSRPRPPFRPQCFKRCRCLNDSLWRLPTEATIVGWDLHPQGNRVLHGALGFQASQWRYRGHSVRARTMAAAARSRKRNARSGRGPKPVHVHQGSRLTRDDPVSCGPCSTDRRLACLGTSAGEFVQRAISGFEHRSLRTCIPACQRTCPQGRTAWGGNGGISLPDARIRLGSDPIELGTAPADLPH